MPKRFTDTEKWKKIWYRKLSPLHKSLWNYLCDNCNHAGVWEVDFELAEIFLGARLNPEEVKTVFAKQYISLNNGKKWLLIDFVPFQYGELNPENRAHKSVLEILEKEGVSKELVSSWLGCKDMVKDKDKDKEKEKTIRKPIFDDIWNKYPNKVGRKAAERHFKASVKTQEDFEHILIALDNYLHSERVKKGFVQNGSTWFNNWQDWVVSPDPKSKFQRIKDKYGIK